MNLHREHPPEGRILLRPADPDHAPIRLLLGQLVRREDDRLAADRAVQDQPADPLRVGDRVGHRDGRAAGHAEEGEPLDSGRRDDRLEVGQPRAEREVVDGPVGQPEASLVVSDDRRERPELVEEVAPDRALPVVLEVAEPARRDDERRTAAVDRVREPDAIRRPDRT